MKECLACHKQIEDLRHTCPHCGGTTFMQGGSAQDALSALGAMQKQTEAAQHVDRGARFILQGRYGEAKTELSRAIEINPLNATAHANMGNIFFRQGRYEESIPWLEKALELNPLIEGVPEALAQARGVTQKKQSPSIIDRYQVIGGWIGALLIGSVVLIASVLQPIDGVPGYKLITKEDPSIIFAFAFSFMIGAMVGGILGSILGIKVGKKIATQNHRT